MLKNFMLFAFLSLAVAVSASAAVTQQYPIPPCYPCGGDGN